MRRRGALPVTQVQLLNIGRQMRNGVHSDSLSVQRRLSHHSRVGQQLVAPSSWLALMIKKSAT